MYLTRDGVLLKSVYDTNDKTIKLVDTEGSVVFNSVYTNVHSAKINLKKTLKELGVPFTDEVRRKVINE
jgi:hypothetical protein